MRSLFAWKAGVVFFLLAGWVVPAAFAETTEIVTYYPTSGGGNEHLNDLTVGPGYLGENPNNGVALIETALGIGTNNPQDQLELTENLRLPPTTATTGIIKSGANRFIHNFGASNFFAGVNAGNLTLTGSANVGIGINAMQSLTNGTQNVAVGPRAMESTTSGQRNSAFGMESLNNNTTGGLNTALGHNTLFFNQTGFDNTAVGYQALLNTTGSDNVAVGQNAGSNLLANANTTGSGNTFIGTRSGSGVAAQLTNATALGFEALVSASNALVLGGTGANAVNVGIGTETPSATLDVNSGSVRVSRDASDAAASAAPQNGMVYYNTTTNNYRAYQNGRWVELSPARPSVYVNAASSQMLFSTTYADDSELQVTIGPGERWQFEIVAVVKVYVDTDLKFKFTGPGTSVLGDIIALATMFKTGNAAGGPGVASTSYWSCIFDAYTDAQVVDFTTDGFVHIFITGELRNSAATAGTFHIQWALRNPPGGNASVWRARYLRATRTA